MVTWLLATDEMALFHQCCCPPAAQFYAFGGNHRGNISCACETITPATAFTYKAESRRPCRVRFLWLPPVFITAAMNPKHIAHNGNRKPRSEFLN
ncbi:hypothetical protein SY86_24820 [Erwinia tracheiphila]|uniref:Uncharacterized protein n=1 Tax=Erwinia tracheiphila TaxID=65700 RepID=A0A0M2KAF5_9GAMM|nr:hypothetical protein SY86_24820 [Erwinia tracheiphila]